MPQPRTLALFTVLAGLVFALWPGLDLDVSGLFFRAGHGFPLAADATLQHLRMALWGTGDALGLAAGAMWGLAAFLGGAVLGIGARVWGFVFLAMALGPGLAVNAVIKPLWGRARPADVAAFGGSHGFTPALIPADQCHWACSFVSGEATEAAVLALAIGVLLRARWSAPMRWLWPLQVALVVLAAGLRVATGRHFLSDVVFGALVALWLSLLVARLVGLPADLAARGRT